ASPTATSSPRPPGSTQLPATTPPSSKAFPYKHATAPAAPNSNPPSPAQWPPGPPWRAQTGRDTRTRHPHQARHAPPRLPPARSRLTTEVLAVHAGQREELLAGPGVLAQRAQQCG